MFPEYRTTVALPEENTTKDFDVPSTHNAEKIQ
jgi:hypothetical protein